MDVGKNPDQIEQPHPLLDEVIRELRRLTNGDFQSRSPPLTFIKTLVKISFRSATITLLRQAT